MYPNLPYPGHSWSLTHHMGRVTPQEMYHTLHAATMFADSNDPSANINSYLNANDIFTDNVRKDSGQSDTWRDYQQVLSELGLIFSTKLSSPKTITPTTLGLAYLDGSLSFSELMSLQALRYQYPNGHKTNISKTLQKELRGTSWSQVQNLANLQTLAGIRLRPAILIWRTLRGLTKQGEQAHLTIDEIQTYLLRCSSHKDSDNCLISLINARQGKSILLFVGDRREKRDIQEWISFLGYTSLFEGSSRNNLRISDFGILNSTEIDDICTNLERDSSFWLPVTFNQNSSRSWYAQYGTLDLGVALLPSSEKTLSMTTQNIEYVGGPEEIDTKEKISLNSNVIRLREFNPVALQNIHSNLKGGAGVNIETSYSAELASRAHRNHDLMVILIGSICREKGATVMDDPNTVDLLVEFQNQEFIIEVKSVTSKNLIDRLRYAIGQVSHYDFLRSNQSQLQRRKVIGLAAHVPSTAWFIPFLNNHLDCDLLSLDGENLKVNSPHSISNELFNP